MATMIGAGRAVRAAGRFGEGILEDSYRPDDEFYRDHRAGDEGGVAAPAAAPAPRGRAGRAEGGAGPDGRLTVDQFDFTRHDGTVTIRNPATGGHRTFRIETLRGDWNPGKRVVSLLDGPDNTSNYRRFAFIDEFGIKVWHRFRLKGEGGQPGYWEKYARMIENPRHFAEKAGLEYMISGRRRRCGRVLSTPRSVALGIGPRCEEMG